MAARLELRARRSPRPSASGYAEADPSDDVTGRDAAAKMAILARLAFGTPVHLDDVPLRGHRAPARRRPGVRARARPRAEADRHRRAPRRRAVGARAPDVPLLRASARRRSRARSTRSPSSPRRSPRSRMSGPGRRRAPDGERGARRRRQRDDRRRAAAGAAAARCALIEDVESAFYLHLDVADRPGVLAAVTQVLGEQERLDQVGRAARHGRARAAGDGHPPGARVAPARGRRRGSASSTSCAPPRARSV